MKESDLLGKLISGQTGVFLTIDRIRDKYGISEVRPEETKLSFVTLHEVCRLS